MFSLHKTRPSKSRSRYLMVCELCYLYFLFTCSCWKQNVSTNMLCTCMTSSSRKTTNWKRLCPTNNIHEKMALIEANGSYVKRLKSHNSRSGVVKYSAWYSRAYRNLSGKNLNNSYRQIFKSVQASRAWTQSWKTKIPPQNEFHSQSQLVPNSRSGVMRL